MENKIICNNQAIFDIDQPVYGGCFFVEKN